MDFQGRMERIVSYLKFLGVILVILLLGLVLKWLGFSHIFDLLFEVIFRAGALGTIFAIAFILYESAGETKGGSFNPFKSIVSFGALFGAAALMTFWEQLFPGF